MPVINIFDERVEKFNEEAKLHLEEEMFGDEVLSKEESQELLSIEEIAALLEISEEDARFLMSCGMFKTYRTGDENRIKKKSIEEKEKIIKAALEYRDKKTITVPELGKILGLGKTAVYRLVNKCYFKSYVVCGVVRVDVESFDEWYAGQFHYKKVDGERPGKKYGSTISSHTLGKVLGISKSTGFDLLNRGEIEYVMINGKRRVPIENYWNWYNNQSKYKMVKTIEEVEGYAY